jgi:DNA-binding helix-hairpin-helix protein with protein kinase domain
VNAGARTRRTLRAGDIVHDEFGNPLQLLERLGRGGQGEVWSVYGGRAAVKVLTKAKGQDSERLRTRLAVVRRFDLSGISIARPLAMLGADRVGYAMELLADMVGIGALAVVPSQDVSNAVDWYRRTGGLRRRLRLLTLAADALGTLHGRAIIYGDISPSNVLVSRGSGYEQVWLIDPDNLVVESSPIDESSYSPGYGAPELIAAQTGCTTSTDVFSFAVLAFQVLTLIHPFRGDQVYADPALEEEAFSGRMPWIDHHTDGSNRTRFGLARDSVLTKGLSTQFRRTFEAGLHEPDNRPLMSELRTKLDQAALATMYCQQ